MPLTTTITLVAVVAFVVYRAVQSSPSPGLKVGAVLGLCAGIAPAVWTIAARDVPPKLVIGYGVLFWLGSVLLKSALFVGVFEKYVYPRVPPAVQPVLHGLLSSACEMGAAVAAFSVFLPDLPFWHVFGFGAGAAASEALTISLIQNPLAGTTFGEHAAAQLAKSAQAPFWLAAATGLAERGIATADHIACRGLVAAGVATGQIWLTTLGFLAFAATDGFVAYCLWRKWDFSEPKTAARMFGPLTLIAVISTLLWILV